MGNSRRRYLFCGILLVILNLPAEITKTGFAREVPLSKSAIKIIEPLLDNGGVLSHYLLNRSDFPSISNWWGIIILPLLAWFSTSRIKKRITFPLDGVSIAPKMANGILIGFFGMLIVSILQSLAFKLGYENITMYMALGVLITGLFLPIYRAECILGHVLAAAFTFGPVIPFIGILVMASVSAFSNLCLKPLILRIVERKASAA